MFLGVVVIVVLLVAWAAVLAPSLLGRRAGDERDGFNETMGSLAATARPETSSGRFVMVPKGPRPKGNSRRELVVRRRRATFERLLVIAAATFLIALIPGLRAFFFAHLATLAALVGYALWLKGEKTKEFNARRARVMAVREEERMRRLERQERLAVEQDHIEAALASTTEDIDAHGFGRAVGHDG